MGDLHRRRVGLAFRCVADVMIGLDAAIDGAGKARIELAHDNDERGIERSEKHARRRCPSGAVDIVEHAVAEHAVVIEVVGDGQIERLVEMGEPFWRPGEDRPCQNRKHDDADDPCNNGVEFGHVVPISGGHG